MDNATIGTAGWAAVYASGATALGGAFGIWLQQRFVRKTQGDVSLSTERQSLLSGIQTRLEASELSIGRLMDIIKDLQEALRDCEGLHRADIREIREIERKNELLEHEKDVLAIRVQRLELRLPPESLDSDYDNGKK
jgi:uncharacterized protein HemX